MTEILTKSKLIAALRDSKQRAENWFQGIAADEFFTRQRDAWSSSHNVDHLIKAVKPVSKALKLPKITLQAMFGKPEKPSMSYEELCQIYRDEIAKGAQASGRYLPNQETPVENIDDKKKALLDQWSKANDELLSVLETWKEDEMN